jgi:hypothetical protein
MPRGAHSRSGNGRFERTVETARRDAQAANLRAQGMTYTDIMDEMGYDSPGTVYSAVQRALLATVAEPAAEARVFELRRLDMALLVAFRILRTDHAVLHQGQKVLDGETGLPLIDDKPKLMAIDRIVRIAERRAKLLGLDVPTQIQVLSPDVIDAEIARLSAELGLSAGGVAAIEAAPAS